MKIGKPPKKFSTSTDFIASKGVPSLLYPKVWMIHLQTPCTVYMLYHCNNTIMTSLYNWLPLLNIFFCIEFLYRKYLKVVFFKSKRSWSVKYGFILKVLSSKLLSYKYSIIKGKVVPYYILRIQLTENIIFSFMIQYKTVSCWT